MAAGLVGERVGQRLRAKSASFASYIMLRHFSGLPVCLRMPQLTCARHNRARLLGARISLQKNYEAICGVQLRQSGTAILDLVPVVLRASTDKVA